MQCAGHKRAGAAGRGPGGRAETPVSPFSGGGTFFSAGRDQISLLTQMPKTFSMALVHFPHVRPTTSSATTTMAANRTRWETPTSITGPPWVSSVVLNRTAALSGSFSLALHWRQVTGCTGCTCDIVSRLQISGVSFILSFGRSFPPGWGHLSISYSFLHVTSCSGHRIGSDPTEKSRSGLPAPSVGKLG